jgi:hypothetical protein
LSEEIREGTGKINANGAIVNNIWIAFKRYSKAS